jgi:uncharacterized iron-regulated protein
MPVRRAAVISVLPLMIVLACAHRAAPNAGADPDRPAVEGETSTSTAARPPHGAMAKKWSLPRRVVDGKKGTTLEAEAFFEDLLSARVVYVSEQHNNPHHHAAQLSVIAGMWARDRSIAIGMEMFKRPFQEAVDRYLAGEIDQDELIERTEWDERWGYDFELYAPILEFARVHKIPVHALNAPDEITRTVAGGGLEALTEVQRASLPDLDLANQEHRAVMKEVFDAHHGATSHEFDHFYTAQVIWDETMAYEVARVLKSPNGPKRMIVLAGDGHIRHGFGIPQRAARRGAEPFRTIMPVMLRDVHETLERAPADYLWVMAMRETDFTH